MGENSRVTMSKAKKCFVCGAELEKQPQRRNADGSITPFIYKHLNNDYARYERVCIPCAEEEDLK